MNIITRQAHLINHLPFTVNDKIINGLIGTL